MNILCPFCMEEHDESIKACPNKIDDTTREPIEIPSGYIADVKKGIRVIPVLTVGYSGHGKTCFFSSLFWSLYHNHGDILDKWGDFSFRGLNSETLNNIHDIYVNRLDSKKVPPRTDMVFPVPLILRFKDIPLKSKSVTGKEIASLKDVILIFYDIGGETFNNNKNIIEFTPILKRMKTFIFLISLPLLIDEADTGGKDAVIRMHTLLSTVYNALNDLGQRKEKNLVLCFTMIDRLWGNDDFGPLSEKLRRGIPTAGQADEIWNDFYQREDYSKKVENYIKNEYRAFYNLLYAHFPTVRFTSISALGSEPKEYFVRYKLTEQSFKTLNDCSLPAEIIKSLQTLRDKDFSKDDLFWKEVEKQADDVNSIQKYKAIIMESSEYSSQTGEKQQKIIRLAPSHVFDPILWLLDLEMDSASSRSAIEDRPISVPTKQSKSGSETHSTNEMSMEGLKERIAQHVYANGKHGFDTVAKTRRLSQDEVRFLEKYSAYYSLPPVILDNPRDYVTPNKYISYPLNNQRWVVGRGMYKGNDHRGRPGNYLFHNLIIEKKDFDIFDYNPVKFVKWAQSNELFRNDAPEKKELDMLNLPFEKVNLPVFSVSKDELGLILHVLYYCFHLEILKKPLLLIGTEEECLSFLQRLYSILPYTLREKLLFDTYAYKASLDFNIICFPSENVFRRECASSLRIELETQEYLPNFELEPSFVEKMSFISDKLLSGNVQDLQHIFSLEHQISEGNYNELKDDYSELSEKERDFLITPYKKAVLHYVNQQHDLDLLGIIQEKITTLDDVKLLSLSSKAISELVHTDEGKITTLVKDWLISKGDMGLRNLENTDEKRLAHSLFEAYKALPDSESENENLFRVFLKYELSQRIKLLEQLTTSNLSVLSSEQQEYVLHSVMRGIRNIKTTEEKEQHLNALLVNALKDEKLFLSLIPLIQNTGLEDTSPRIGWMVETGATGDLPELESLTTLENYLKGDKYEELKDAYAVASPDVKTIFLAAHKESVLRHIVKHQDSNFLQELKEEITSADDIAVLTESADLARQFVENHEKTLLPITIEFLCSDRENRGALYPLLLEKPLFWDAFFEKLRNDPEQSAGFLLEFIQSLAGKSYSREFEDAMLDCVMSLLESIRNDHREASAFLQAFKKLPEPQGEERELLKTYIVFSLKPSSKSLKKLVRSNLSLLSKRYDQTVLYGLLREIKTLGTAEKREEFLNDLFRGILEEKVSASLLSEGIETFSLKESSQRTSTLAGMASEGKVDEIRTSFSLESKLEKQEYLSFKEEYSSASQEIQSLTASLHKSEILQTIANNQDAEFVLKFRNTLSSSIDIQLLSAAPEILRALVASNDGKVLELIAEWLLSKQDVPPDALEILCALVASKNGRVLELIAEWLLSKQDVPHILPILFESLPLWRLFFQKLRTQPRQIDSLASPLRLLQSEYREDFEKALLEEMHELVPHIKAASGLAEEMFTILEAFPKSCPAELRLLRHFVAYELSEASYLLEELLEDNIFDLEGRYHKTILDSIMEGILRTESLLEQEQYLDKLFRQAVKNKASLFTTGKSVERNGLKTVFPRIALITEMAVKGDIGGINTFYALEYSLEQHDFDRFKAECSRVRPALKDCVIDNHKKSILQYLSRQPDRELLRLVQERLTSVEDIRMLVNSPDLLRSLVSIQGSKISGLFLELLFSLENTDERQALYPLLFVSFELWKEFLQKLSAQPQDLQLLVEAIKLFSNLDYYSETLEDVFQKEMIFTLIPVIKERRMADKVFNALNRSFPPVRDSREVKILRVFVSYELKPTYGGLSELTDSDLSLLPDELQSLVLNSVVLNGIMSLNAKNDIQRHLRRLCHVASKSSNFLLRLISAIQENRTRLSEQNGKRFRVFLSEALEREIPNNREFLEARQKMTELINRLPGLGILESIFGVG